MRDFPELVQLHIECMAWEGEEPRLREFPTRNVQAGNYPDYLQVDVRKGRRWTTLQLPERLINEIGVSRLPSSGTARKYEGGVWCRVEDREEMLQQLTEALGELMRDDIRLISGLMDQVQNLVDPPAPKP